ncbi:DNA ligase D [Flavobacterium sp. GT3R68]|uniref:DNA ligase D n=1 Tax=Flavobacterium sp. GT3R68 TaxID=2594437 RepID=UPI00163D5E30|nr:DNA ligase D [Flavobacterium sp. GT3R68]
MLATLTEKPFDNEDWIFEVKYDGYRTVAVVEPNDVNLFSRNHISFNKNFGAIAQELKKMKHSAVLDGEIVVEGADGRSNFQLLQNYLKTGKGKLKYYVFDLINLDGNDTSELSLLDRKELVHILLRQHPLKNIHYSEHIIDKGIDFYAMAEKNNLEGIMAKKAEGTYRINQRSNEWLKIKISQQEEAIIIGFTEPQNSRKYFGAILLGRYEDNQLKYIGKCGTGFKEDTLKELYEKFKPYFISESPVPEKISIRDKIQWLKPKLVCQVKFTEWTSDNSLRHPVYLGLRLDKKPKEVLAPTLLKGNAMEAKEKETKTTESNFDLKVGKVNLHLTNQNKIYYPDDGITKGDIVNYYKEVADFILPYIKDRPQSMNRFPSGITGDSFYQKDVDLDKIPSWLKTQKIYSESNKGYIDYLICNDKATLMYMANLGCIEINPWNSTLKHIEKPDWVVIDIDPAKDDFKEVVRTALTVKEIMDELETDCYCKTSGATGLHVYIPLGARYEYDSIKILAELIAREVHSRLPETTSIIRSVKKRDEKIYIDFLQNRQGQTLAAPYSVRPKPGATVSTPLEWKEVNNKLSPSQFTIKNILKRLDKKGDLWKPVLGKGANLEKIIKKFSQE